MEMIREKRPNVVMMDTSGGIGENLGRFKHVLEKLTGRRIGI
jgi:hypothetical protein